MQAEEFRLSNVAVAHGLLPRRHTPPVGYLVLDGQLSALALASLALAVVALDTLDGASRTRAAGAAIGLLGYKVSLLAPALAVVRPGWRGGQYAAAAASTAMLQLAITVPIVGMDVVHRLHMIRDMWAFAGLLTC